MRAIRHTFSKINDESFSDEESTTIDKKDEEPFKQKIGYKSAMTFEGVDADKDEDSEYEESYLEHSIESEDPVDVEPGARIRRSNIFNHLFGPKRNMPPSFHHFPRLSIIPMKIKSNRKATAKVKSGEDDLDLEEDDQNVKVPLLQKRPLLQRLVIPIMILLLSLIITLSVVLRPNGPVLKKPPENFTEPSNPPIFSNSSSAPSASLSPSLNTQMSLPPSFTVIVEEPTNIPSQQTTFPIEPTPVPTNHISLSNSPSIQYPQSSPPSSYPSIRPSANPDRRYEEIRALLEETIVGFNRFSVFDDQSSPQSKSLEWIVFADSKALQLPSQNTTNDMQIKDAKKSIIQRWTIALLWFAFSGPEWIMNSKWLGNHHECEWFGIECTNNIVTKIMLNSNHLVGMIPKEIGYLEDLGKP